MSEINPRSSHEISLLIDEKTKEKIGLDEAHAKIKQEIIGIQFEKAKLQVKQKELEAILNQNDFNLKKLSGELKLLQSEFWTSRNSGL